MKTKVIAALAMLMFTFTLTFAKHPSSSLSQIINSKITFPSTAVDQNIHGTVFAEFTVNAEGKIEVLNCTSLEGELQTYVYKTLSEITVAPDASIVGKTYLMRFDFNIVS